jgi:hypothetical protein
MLQLTAEWVAAGSPDPGARFTPPVAYASSAAFDRGEDADTLAAVALLLAVAHPAGPGPELDDGDAWPPVCPECGGDDPQGTLRVQLLGPVRLLRMWPRPRHLRLLRLTGMPGYQDAAAVAGRGLAVFPLPAGSKAARPGWHRR